MFRNVKHPSPLERGARFKQIKRRNQFGLPLNYRPIVLRPLNPLNYQTGYLTPKLLKLERIFFLTWFWSVVLPTWSSLREVLPRQHALVNTRMSLQKGKNLMDHHGRETHTPLSANFTPAKCQPSSYLQPAVLRPTASHRRRRSRACRYLPLAPSIRPHKIVSAWCRSRGRRIPR